MVERNLRTRGLILIDEVALWRNEKQRSLERSNPWVSFFFFYRFFVFVGVTEYIVLELLFTVQYVTL